MDEETLRKMAIEQYLQGKSPFSIYPEMGRSKYWFFKWLHRYQSGDTDWYKDQSKIPHHHPHATPPEMQNLIKNIRIQLEDSYAQVGTSAIKWEFKKLGINPPSDRISQQPWDSTIFIKQISWAPDISKTMGVSIHSMSWISTVTESFSIPNAEKTTRLWLWA